MCEGSVKHCFSSFSILDILVSTINILGFLGSKNHALDSQMLSVSILACFDFVYIEYQVLSKPDSCVLHAWSPIEIASSLFGLYMCVCNLYLQFDYTGWILVAITYFILGYSFASLFKCLHICYFLFWHTQG